MRSSNNSTKYETGPSVFFTLPGNQREPEVSLLQKLDHASVLIYLFLFTFPPDLVLTNRDLTLTYDSSIFLQEIQPVVDYGVTRYLNRKRETQDLVVLLESFSYLF